MKVLDLSHTISPIMPVYSDSETPEVSVLSTIEDDGFAEKKITLCSHTGTHADAPAHIIKKAKTLDQLPLDHFVGNASVLNFAHHRKADIDIQDLEPFWFLFEENAFVLLCTGWNRLWGQDAYFKGYPALTRAAAEWIARFDLKGIGMDTISADKADADDFPIHTILLEKNIIIIENLTNLEKLSNIQFIFCCLPMKMENSDGSPVRAVALCT